MSTRERAEMTEGEGRAAREQGGGADPLAPRVFTEPWPSGGWAVRLAGHPVPISRHDTEDEAAERATAYGRGLARERQ